MIEFYIFWGALDFIDFDNGLIEASLQPYQNLIRLAEILNFFLSKNVASDVLMIIIIMSLTGINFLPIDSNSTAVFLNYYRWFLSRWGYSGGQCH